MFNSIENEQIIKNSVIMNNRRRFASSHFGIIQAAKKEIEDKDALMQNKLPSKFQKLYEKTGNLFLINLIKN